MLVKRNIDLWKKPYPDKYIPVFRYFIILYLNINLSFSAILFLFPFFLSAPLCFSSFSLFLDLSFFYLIISLFFFLLKYPPPFFFGCISRLFSVDYYRLCFSLKVWSTVFVLFTYYVFFYFRPKTMHKNSFFTKVSKV